MAMRYDERVVDIFAGTFQQQRGEKQFLEFSIDVTL